MAKIGENIRNKRIALKMTQEELANRMGYKSKSTINKIEQGINDIPQSKIAKFAEVLGTSPFALMGWVDEQTSKKNDVLANIVLQMRKDDELLSMVEMISKFSIEKRQAVLAVITALQATEK